jgi:hypothetical protein
MQNDHLLTTGAAIVERLKAACPSARGNVFSTRDLEDVEEGRQVAPALHVLLYSYSPSETCAGGARWEEVWFVVAVVRHSARTERATALALEGSALLHEAFAALSGWHPVQDGQRSTTPLTAIDGPRPGFSETHAYFPLAFAATLFTTGIGERG